ncbi:MAG: hypothetical protein ABIH41_03195 [Nanoarchaeota archaeon]
MFTEETFLVMYFFLLFGIVLILYSLYRLARVERQLVEMDGRINQILDVVVRKESEIIKEERTIEKTEKKLLKKR